MFDGNRIKGIEAIISLANSVGKIASYPRLEAMAGFADVLRPVIDSRLADHALHISSVLKPVMDSTYLIRERQAIIPEFISRDLTTINTACSYSSAFAEHYRDISRIIGENQKLLRLAEPIVAISEMLEYSALNKFNSAFDNVGLIGKLWRLNGVGFIGNAVAEDFRATRHLTRSFERVVTSFPSSLVIGERDDEYKLAEEQDYAGNLNEFGRSVTIAEIITFENGDYATLEKIDFEETLELLELIEPKLALVLYEAIDAFKAKRFGYRRHVSSSMRIVIKGLIKHITPDSIFYEWSDNGKFVNDAGKPTWVGRIRCFFERFPITTGVAFIENDINFLLSLIRIYDHRAKSTSTYSKEDDKRFESVFYKSISVIKRLCGFKLISS